LRYCSHKATRSHTDVYNKKPIMFGKIGKQKSVSAAKDQKKLNYNIRDATEQNCTKSTLAKSEL